MSVTEGEHVLILTDRSTLEVGQAIANAAEKVTGGNVKLLVIEDYVERPTPRGPHAKKHHTRTSMSNAVVLRF